MVIKPIAYSCYMIYKITIIILLCYTISFTIIGHCGKNPGPSQIVVTGRRRPSKPTAESRSARWFLNKNLILSCGKMRNFLAAKPFLDVRQFCGETGHQMASNCIFFSETSAESERRHLGFVVEHRMISFARDFFWGRRPWRSIAGGSWYYQILTWSMINDDVPRCHHLCQSLYIYICIHIHKPWYPTNIQFMSMYVLMI